MREHFCRAAARKPKTWQFPVLACEAVGGSPEQVIPAAAAIGCLQLAIILIDDLLDDDPRGEYRRIGAGAAANLASAFQAAGLEAIAHCRAEPGAKLAAIRRLNEMMQATARGQHLDIQNPADEESYWRLVRAKSSPYFGAALCVGALLGGASEEVAERLRQLGELYGEMIQIHDDLSDALAAPANPDWTQGRHPLPVLFAEVVDHPDRGRFLELRAALTADPSTNGRGESALTPGPSPRGRGESVPDALTEAQTILIRCGAVSYCVDQLIQRHERARGMLAEAPIVRRDGLEGLAEEVIRPVERLLDGGAG